MQDTYSLIYIQVVFAVKCRQSLIPEGNREELQRFISKVIEERNAKLIAIYCMPDHCHIFIGLKPVRSISDLVKEVKSTSSKFINEKKWIKGKFSWQDGFGAFSYCPTKINEVHDYVVNQKEHHNIKSFKEEYVRILDKSELEYDTAYLFEG
ncbi:MAG: transposase [Bacteroidota bacterium]|jgi:REP element-mobilizing transposase RayT|nr:transposase [Bacteroidota bacterium]